MASADRDVQRSSLDMSEVEYVTVVLLTEATYLRTFVLVVQQFGVGFEIERSLVRLPAGALSSQLGQLSLPSLRDR